MNWADKMLKSSRNTTYFLKRYYIGKFLGARRLEQIVGDIDNDDYKTMAIQVFRNEKKHVVMIEQLLSNRGLPLPRAGWRKTRYWRVVKREMSSIEQQFAIAHYITRELQERSEAIISSKFVPNDIKVVFQKILKDERKAAEVYRLCSSQDSLLKMKSVHDRGISLLKWRD
jgi:hypothetical protein